MYGNREVLFDPWVQNDDARVVLFPFHRHATEASLVDDPIASEMLAYVPPLFRCLYAVLVPVLGLFAATKVVQALALGLVVWSSWILARSRKAGLAAGLLLLFLVLHSSGMVNRVAGGLPRAFGFPVLALWSVGVLVRGDRLRLGAVLLGAAFYPPAMLIALAGEGLRILPSFVRSGRLQVARGLVLCALMGVGSLVIIAPYQWSNRHFGPIHTLAQAETDPSFGPEGRLRVLPLPDPVALFAQELASPFRAEGSSPVPGLQSLYADLQAFGPVAWLVVLLGVSGWGRAPAPAAAGALVAGAAVSFAVAIAVAFRLYSPDRFAVFGASLGTAVLVVSTVGLIRPRRVPAREWATVRNWAAAGFILAIWLFIGDGVVARNGGTIDGRDSQELWAQLSTLPSDIRIAAHPMDADDIAFWSGRAATDSWETLQPWHVGIWNRQRARTEQTLKALYATRREEVLAYAAERNVTHFLLRRGRYGAAFRERALFLAPFDDFLRALLSSRDRQDLVLATLPDDAIVFEHGPLRLVDVERLRLAWSQSGGPVRFLDFGGAQRDE